MKNVLGLLNFQEKNTLIRELAAERPVEMIPFAGRYRLIDFALSNLVNSGIRTVGVMLPEQSRAVLDHLRSGKDWDLARHHGGLTILPPARIGHRYDGDLKNFYNNLDFVRNTPEEYVLITDGNFVDKLDFNLLLEMKQQTNADITLCYSVAETAGARGVLLQVGAGGTVNDIAFQQEVPPGSNLSLGICLLKKELYIDLVRSTFERGGTDFVLDVLMRQHRDYHVVAVKHNGYAREINSTVAYFRASMDLFDMSVFNELFRRGNRVATKAKDKSPVRYADTARVKNSLVANGCDIAGEVENSILFRGVVVERGVKIKNSIIMQSGVLKENALLEYVICDKNVVIGKDKYLRGDENYPVIVSKNVEI